MRDLLKSMVRLSVAMPALAAKQAADIWRTRGDTRPLTGDFARVSDAVEAQLDGATKDLFERGVRLEREVLGTEAKTAPKVEPAELPVAVHSGDLDTRTLVVLGE